MRTVQVDLLSDASNLWVIRTPGREHPAVVIQGDSLRTLYNRVSRLVETAQQESCDPDIIDLAIEIRDVLKERVDHFERTLAAHHLSLPYPS